MYIFFSERSDDRGVGKRFLVIKGFKKQESNQISLTQGKSKAIRGGIEDNSKIIFLIFQRKHML